MFLLCCSILFVRPEKEFVCVVFNVSWCHHFAENPHAWSFAIYSVLHKTITYFGDFFFRYGKSKVSSSGKFLSKGSHSKKNRQVKNLKQLTQPGNPFLIFQHLLLFFQPVHQWEQESQRLLGLLVDWQSGLERCQSAPVGHNWVTVGMFSRRL